MVAFKSLNSSPVFTQHLVATGVFADEPMTVIDVGARGGFEGHWAWYKDQVKLIGFEADAEECARLNQQSPGSPNRFFPFALHHEKGRRKFYVTANAPSSGFYPAEMGFFGRFQDETNLTVKKTIEMDTIDLDSVVTENGLGTIDFIKLDTEGNELDILEGAVGCLKKSVLGLSVEVAFTRLHENQPVFNEVDSFLMGLGFRLYDLALYRLGRKSLPPAGAPSGPVDRGQLVAAQALYFRDGVAELESGNGLEDGWKDTRVLKLASILELFSLPDCSIELVQAARKNGLLKHHDVDNLIDLLVPLVNKIKLSYDEYLQRAKAGNLNTGGGEREEKTLVKLVPRPLRPLVRWPLIRIRNLINTLAGV